MASRDWDEDDVRVRPGRSTRPRSKRRPDFAHAVAGVVIAVDRGRFLCLVDGREVNAVKARHLGRKGLVVGDRVRMEGEITGAPDALARIVLLEKRTNVLRRTADDDDPTERVLVANADQLAIVTALADPAPSVGLIDRCLVAAFDAGIAPLLIMTKRDKGDPQQLLEAYGSLDFPVFVRDKTTPLGPITEALAGKTTVLVGHSGVGKSTLVNALVPEAERAVGRVNEVTGRGRHTSTSAIGFSFEGGLLIDTPGVRSFGLAHVSPDNIVATFTDLAPGLVNCPRGCTHDEAECGLDAWAEEQGIDPARLLSLRRLLAARRG